MLTYLQANKLACPSFMADAEDRDFWSGTKDVIHSSLSRSFTFTRVTCPYQLPWGQCEAAERDAVHILSFHNNQGMQAKGNPTFYNRKQVNTAYLCRRGKYYLIIMDSLLQWPPLPRKTSLSPSSKAVHYTNILERAVCKKSCQCCYKSTKI